MWSKRNRQWKLRRKRRRELEAKGAEHLQKGDQSYRNTDNGKWALR